MSKLKAIIPLSRDKVVQEGLELLHRIFFRYLARLENDFLAKYNRRLTSKNQCDKEKVLEIIKVKSLVHRSIKVGEIRYVGGMVTKEWSQR